MTNSLPIEILESHAAAQRRQLHNDVADLKSTLRQTLDAKKMARQYLGPVAGAAALLGLLAGYGATGLFTRK